MDAIDIFSVPVSDRYIVYAPLHGLAALVCATALKQIRDNFLNQDFVLSDTIRPIVELVKNGRETNIGKRTGPLADPLFLGVIPTRGCNLGCRYCDFAAPKETSPVMDIKLARKAVDAYLALCSRTEKKRAEIHFFGGEPFCGWEVVQFLVEYTRLHASRMGLGTHFEATTNGVYIEKRCRWIADYFDTIVLSLDGPPDIQDHHRPGINGKSAFDIVYRNAKLFSDGAVELILRTCVTQDTVARLPEIAQWMAQEFRPSTICFESLTPTSLSRSAGFIPPDPWAFASYFEQAAQVLENFGIETVLSTADLQQRRVYFCPVGQDALILSPDGTIDACYLLQENWEQKGLDLHLGRINLQRNSPESVFEIEQTELENMRKMTVDNRLLCTDCLCRYHCAGGCIVNHNTSASPGQYDDLCIQTRLITVVNLLKRMGEYELARSWLLDRPAMEIAVWQPSDRLLSVGGSIK